MARIEPVVVMTSAWAGWPGHGSTAFLRNQQVRTADGRVKGANISMYELICPSCGDQPQLDYSEIAPRLRQLRGPHSLEAALAAYHRHLGLSWRTAEPDSSGRERAGGTATR